MLHEPPPELKLEVVIEEARDHHATKDQNSFSSIGEQARKAAIRTTQLGEPAQSSARPTGLMEADPARLPPHLLFLLQKSRIPNDLMASMESMHINKDVLGPHYRNFLTLKSYPILR
ncbi:unnamed protein product [Boreogadus saida]